MAFWPALVFSNENEAFHGYIKILSSDVSHFKCDNVLNSLANCTGYQLMAVSGLLLLKGRYYNERRWCDYVKMEVKWPILYDDIENVASRIAYEQLTVKLTSSRTWGLVRRKHSVFLTLGWFKRQAATGR